MDNRTSIAILAGLWLTATTATAEESATTKAQAHNCIKVVYDDTYLTNPDLIMNVSRFKGVPVFVNHCDFTVRVAWCFTKPRKNRDDPRYDTNEICGAQHKIVGIERHGWFQEFSRLTPSSEDPRNDSGSAHYATTARFPFTEGDLFSAACNEETDTWPKGSVSKSLALIASGKLPEYHCVPFDAWREKFHEPDWTPPDAEEARNAGLGKAPKPKRRPEDD